MTGIYEISKEQCAVFFDRGNQLILQYKEGERIGRPILLANDYVGGFEAVVFDGTVYFLYQSDRGETLLRNLRDNMIYYQLREGRVLQMSVQSGTLIVWELDEPKDQDRCRLQYICPFQPQANRVVLETLPSKQVVQLVKGEQYTYILCGDSERSDARYEAVYRMDREFQVEKLAPQDTRQRDEQEKRLRQALAEVERLSRLLEERGQELQNKELQMKRLQEMIDSASHQYKELMHVAEQYRDEAVKWRSKFIF